jgi:type II restriction enzyme
MRDFDSWLSRFKKSISDYGYYVDFEKIYCNVESVKLELNILNSLIGSNNIEYDFDLLLTKYPECLKCIPLLLAVRKNEIRVIDGDGEFCFSFCEMNYTMQEYKTFMRKTGLFNLLQKRILNNLIDYVTGVETGLDSNGRTNRGGYLMENLVESHLQKVGLIADITYFKEMSISDISDKWCINLSALSNNGKTEKKFDFVVKNYIFLFFITKL